MALFAGENSLTHIPRSQIVQAASSSRHSRHQLGPRNGVPDFSSNFQARGRMRNGTAVEAEYYINRPTGVSAYFNMLLDASGSMFSKQDSGDATGQKKHVYQILFECFDELVSSGDALRPDDTICIWSFNRRTTLLCEVKTRNYHKEKGNIRKLYENELKSSTWNCETRLYDAVVQVVDTKIRKTWDENKEADFFLVTFTDGRDSSTGTATLDGMMMKLHRLLGRLHTFFITTNWPTHSDLGTRLENQQEMKLIHCKNTQPSEISRAFNTVRDLIKAVLHVVTIENHPNARPQFTRFVQSGRTVESIRDQMYADIVSRPGALIDAFAELQLKY